MTADYWTAFWQGVGAATSVFVVLVDLFLLHRIRRETFCKKNQVQMLVGVDRAQLDRLKDAGLLKYVSSPFGRIYTLTKNGIAATNSEPGGPR